MVTTEQDEESLGKLLAAARKKLGVSVEEAARETRIHVDRIRDMEADRFFQFVHPSYARMFLRDYARYLSVPLDQLRSLLPDAGDAISGGPSYITRYTAPERTPMTPPQKKKGSWIFMALVILFLGLATYQIWKAMQSPATQPIQSEEDVVREESTEIAPKAEEKLKDEDAQFIKSESASEVRVALPASATSSEVVFQAIAFTSIVLVKQPPKSDEVISINLDDPMPVRINPDAWKFISQ